MNKRFIILVIDGLGVGAMPDVNKTRPQDIGSNTLKHILLNSPGLKIPNLIEIGTINYFVNSVYKQKTYKKFNVSLGKFRLAHFGADSFVGHQEIAGTKPKKPIRQFVRDVKNEIIKALKKDGYKAEFKKKIVIVNEYIAIADNIEADYGHNINVVGCLDYIPYSMIEKVARIVRGIVKTGRVLAIGGVDISPKDFYRCFEIKTKDDFTAWGVNIPKLNIYNDKHRVIHMGYGIDPRCQAPSILLRKKIPVTLIGKAADVIDAKGAHYLPMVYTDKVLDLLKQQIKKIKNGFIFANVQETDLSGHSQDVKKYGRYLELIDKTIPKILSVLNKNDVLIITGDHGNDPTLNSSHTRELTPLIIFSKTIKSSNFGERKTLSDIGATATKFFDAELTENGKPIF